MQSEITLTKLYCELKSFFKSVKINSAGFDAVQIIKHYMGFDRHDILVNPNLDIDVKSYMEIKKMAARRARGEPLQYILGKWFFMDYDLKVGPGVLIPREDTQVLVTEAFSFLDERKAKIKNVSRKILELCTGSGAISIALAKRYSQDKVIALDFSRLALEYCKKNIERHTVSNIELIQYDVLQGPEDQDIFTDVDVIVANPPYIPTENIKNLQKEVQHEPFLALDGGYDGLDFYRVLAKQWMNIIVPGGKMFLEVGIDQANAVSDLFQAEGYLHISVTQDLNGIDRVIAIER